MKKKDDINLYEIASLKNRIIAAGIDFLIIIIIYNVLFVIISFFIVETTRQPFIQNKINKLPGHLILPVYFIFCLINYIFIKDNQQTIGKKINKIKMIYIIDEKKSNVISKPSIILIIRYFFIILLLILSPVIASILLLIINLPFILTSKYKRSIHDYYCGTVVVKDGSKKLFPEFYTN